MKRLAVGLLVVLVVLWADTLGWAQAASSASSTTRPAQIVTRLLRGGWHLILPVRINGHDAGLFLLDTGAISVHLDRKFAQELGLSPLTGPAKAAGGAEIQIFSLDQVEAGGITAAHNVLASASDLSDIRQAAGTDQIKGILGMSFLGRQPFSVNWAEAKLTIYADKPAPGAGAVSCELRSLGSLPALKVSIRDDVSGWFTLDTGADTALILSPSFAQLNSYWLDDMPGRVKRVIGVGGAREYRDLKLPEAKIAGIPLTDVDLDYTLLAGIAMAPEAAGTIGQRILARFEVTFDCANKRAWVRNIPDAEFIPSEWRDADFDAKSADIIGETSLMRAADLKRSDYVKRFIDAGTPIQAQDNDGATALHHACAAVDPGIVRLLLNSGAAVNAATKESQTTPLIAAAEHGSREIVDALLASGAKADQADVYDRTALIVAAEAGNRAIVEALLKYNKGLLNHVSAASGSALNAAARNGRTEVAEFLVETGAELKNVDRRNNPLLFAAAYGGSVRLVDLLLSRGLDPNAKTPTGQTAIFAAAVRGHSEVIQLLLDHGGDPNIADQQGRKALDYAVAGGQLACMNILIAKR